MRTVLSSFLLLAALLLSPSSIAATAPKADVAAVVNGGNAFAFDLYRQLRVGPGNLFFSPSSISTALAMTSAGARGQTVREMAKTLHFTLEPKRLHPAYASLLADLNARSKKGGYQMSVANALWGQKGYGFLPEFLQLTRANYGAGLMEVDFRRSPEAARLTINTWIERQTQSKIQELLKTGTIDTFTRLVLTNAIYFKGDWDSQFNKDATSAEPFQISASAKVNAPMMHQTHHFGYFDAGTFHALEMPYVGKDLSMVVLLPKKAGDSTELGPLLSPATGNTWVADGLAALEKSLSAANVAKWLRDMSWRDVIVTLPKFKTTGAFSLAPTLAKMGMPSAFNPKAADFSGMNGKRDLLLSEVVHKSYVDVNEEGTEAAAATGVVITRTSASQPPPPVVFRADHPFIFLIRDMRQGSILFLGRVLDPTK